MWIGVTFLTKPVEEERLIQFYRRVRPGGVGWRRVAKAVPDVTGDSNFGWLFLDWVCGVLLVYAVLFGLGNIILGERLLGVSLLLVSLVAGGVIYWDLSRRGWQQVTR